MNNITVVRIYKPEKYRLKKNQKYGILVRSMQDTALVNFSGNCGGLCINIAHGDYGTVSPIYWKIYDGEVVINGCISKCMTASQNKTPGLYATIVAKNRAHSTPYLAGGLQSFRFTIPCATAHCPPVTDI